VTQTEIPVPAAELPKPKHLFIGVRLSTQSTSALAAAVEQLARRAPPNTLRFQSPTTFHVTLKYLGWAQPEVVEAVADAMREATRGLAPFAFRVRGVGAFPSLAAATVLYAAVEPCPPLVELAARVDRAMVELGFPAETRPYVPHVTIARTETRPLDALVLPMLEQMFSESKVGAITLIESRTNSGASGYSDVRKITFEAAETGPKSGAERQSGPLDLDAHAETDDGWPRGHL
jgi:2'-5' RNA ligase